MKWFLCVPIIFLCGCVSSGDTYRIREYKSSGIVTIEKDGKITRYQSEYYPSTGETVFYKLGGD